MTERPLVFYSESALALQERIDAGKIVHLENFPSGPRKIAVRTDRSGRYYVGRDEETEKNSAYFAKLYDTYGEESVFFGSAVDPETGAATGLPLQLGIYVMADAFEAAQTSTNDESTTH